MLTPLTSDELAALRRLEQARVAVVGDVMLDEFVYGDSSRLSPEAPVPVVSVQQEIDCLGGAANVARNVRDLGCEPVLIGVVGSDVTADRVRRALSDVGIADDHLAVDPKRKTGIKTRVIARGQQLVRIDHESTNQIDDVTATELIRSMQTVLHNCTAVIFSDYGKGVLGPEFLPQLLECVPDGVFTCVDPYPHHAGAYQGLGAITPNNDEARRMWTDDLAHTADGVDVARGLRRQVGVDEIYVTLGKQGMVYCGSDDQPIRHTTRQRQVFDVSGAGDTVVSMVAALRGLNVPPEVTCSLANRAAGLVVEKIGTATVSQAEILDDAGDVLDDGTPDE